MQYLVVESNAADAYDARNRIYDFADSYVRDVHRGTTPSLRHSRATSVGYPVREIVEVIRQPVYEYNQIHPTSRHASRAASVAAFETEPTHFRHYGGRRLRETTPLISTSGLRHTSTLNSFSDTSSYSHYRHPRSRGYSVTGPSQIYKPSMWYIGTAGFREDSHERTRRLQSRLEGIMSYEPPPMDYYLNMKQSLRGINERMLQHRQLIDRYAGVDMSPTKSVEEAVQERYYELVDRMPELERNAPHRSSRAPSEDYTRSKSVASQLNRDRATTPFGSTTETSAVRGKIRKLLNRTKHSN